MLSIQYPIDLNDHLNFQLYNASISESILKKRRKSRIRLPIIYLLLSMPIYFVGNNEFAAFFIIIAVAWYFIYPFYERKIYYKHYKKYVEENAATLVTENSKIEFDDTEIKTYDELGNSSIKIHAISSIEETSEYYFIKIGTQQGLIIPKIKISNLSDLQDWLKQTQMKYHFDWNHNLDWSWK